MNSDERRSSDDLVNSTTSCATDTAAEKRRADGEEPASCHQPTVCSSIEAPNRGKPHVSGDRARKSQIAPIRSVVVLAVVAVSSLSVFIAVVAVHEPLGVDDPPVPATR
jgi:hypothetical protein